MNGFTKSTKGALTTALDALAGTVDLADAEDRASRRLIVGFGVVVGAFGALFTVLFALRPEFHVSRDAHFAVGLAAIVAFSSPLSLRFFGTRTSAIILVTDYHLCVSFTPLLGDGITDAILWWLPVSPLLAAFILGGTAGSIVGALVFLQLWAMYGLTEADLVPFVPYNPDQPFFIALAASTAVAVLTLIARAYARSREGVEALIAEKLVELAERQSVLETMKKHLEDARDATQIRDEEKAVFLRVMGRNASALGSALEEAAAAVSEMNTSVHLISENVNAVQRDATSSASSADNVVLSAEEMARTAAQMKERVADVARAVTSLKNAFGAVGARVSSVSAAAKTASDEGARMSQGMVDIEDATKETTRLAQRVTDDATRGSNAVDRTLAGIRDIETRSANVSQAIRALSGHAANIGRVVDVIDEVVAQTNLLALNAGIIAAQAGNEGASFLVVADEMKKLSQRTSESTREIADAIEAILARTQEAVSAIEQGEAAIATGLARGRETEAAFEQILASTGESTTRIAGIEKETARQVERTERFTAELEKVAANLVLVTTSFVDETLRTEEVARSASEMNGLAEVVASRAKLAETGGREIAGALTRVRDKITQLESAQKEQARASTQILASLEQIHSRQDAQVNSLKALEASETTLRPGLDDG